jgi:hypothetical protein
VGAAVLHERGGAFVSHGWFQVQIYGQELLFLVSGGKFGECFFAG